MNRQRPNEKEKVSDEMMSGESIRERDRQKVGENKDPTPTKKKKAFGWRRER